MSSDDSGGRRRDPRRPELRRPLPAGWTPKGAVLDQIKACNLDPPKVLDLYRTAMAEVELKRWRDDTFLRWFDEALLTDQLRDAVAVRGMPVIFRRPYNP